MTVDAAREALADARKQVIRYQNAVHYASADDNWVEMLRAEIALTEAEDHRDYCEQRLVIAEREDGA